MLNELKDVRQVPGEPERRWFTSTSMDLIYWHDEKVGPYGFQLCYDKDSKEKVITWRKGFLPGYGGINSGEDTGLKYKESPILINDGYPDLQYVARCFSVQSDGLPTDVK